MRRMERWLTWCSWTVCVACGGAPAEPVTSGDPSLNDPGSPRVEAHGGASEPTSGSSGLDDDATDETSSEPGDAASQAAADERAATASEERDIVYRVTPNGLVVEVDGARFKPAATAKKLGGGAYGIELTVVAEGVDDRTHVLLSPKQGPLSLAATIFDKHGKVHTQYGDTRDGEDQEFLMPGGTLTLTRSWPSGSVKGPLWWGQRVRLEVGLWGLGAEQDPGRPVRKLFAVEMVGGNKPSAVVTPPEL